MSGPPSAHPASDRNLLFGILALQMDFIGRDALIAAMHAWVLDKAKPLGQILQEQGSLRDDERALLDGLVAKHVENHGQDPERSLAAVTVPSSVHQALRGLGDSDVETSLGPVGRERRSDPEATVEEVPDGGPRYRILRPHARGGLGEVFVALDRELHREVALKEIQPERARDPGSRARFLVEAEITGRLEHPGIVPVYGMGCYPDARPFYAMRLIKGDSLKDALPRFHARPDFHGPEFRQLLGSVLAVCNAVAYAHSRGVLHRDLKPANIMLGPFGETLVVDWGLAKVLGREGTGAADGAPPAEATLQPVSGSDHAQTLAGSAVGTPAYMSPEQAAGRLEELSPASDVYSLGATLYAVLTGRAPFEGSDRGQLLRRVQHGDFPPPRRVQPAVPPALDAVCRKAMAREPAARYPTPLDLAADLEHWLADEPVAAYPEPWTVRAGRWARRHRTAVVGAGVFLASAVIALAVSTARVSAEQRRTLEQKQVALANYAIAREQSLNIIKLIESAEPELAAVPALHDRRAELLRTTSDACREFLRQEPDDLELVKRAALIYRFAANFDRLTNDTGRAEALYQDAVALQERLTAAFPEDGARRLDLADTLRDYANLQFNLGRLPEAAASAQRSREIAEGLAGQAQPPGARRAVARALLLLAAIDYRRGTDAGADGAEKTIRRSVALLRGLAEGTPEGRGPYDPLLLAAALNLTALIDRDAGRLEAANAAHKEAIALLNGIEKNPKIANAPDLVHFLAECRVEQAKTWAKTPMPKYRSSAETNVGLAITQLDELARAYPKIPTYQASLGAAYRERGRLRLQGNNYQGARQDFRKSAEVLAPFVQKYPQLPTPRGELGGAYAGLAAVAARLGDDDPGLWITRAAGELQEALTRSPEDAQLQRSLAELGKNKP